MKNYLMSLLIILLIFSCDRFEHKFEPEIPEENPIYDFWDDFAIAWQDIIPGNVDAVMVFYDDEYSNDLQTKTDIENFYLSLFNLADSVVFNTTLVDPVPPEDREQYDVTWQLQVTDQVTSQVVLDTTFVDIVIGDEDILLFYGNQAAPPIYQKVLAELGTATTCSSCPYAEEALNQLKQEYGDQFYYIEYHLGDQLEVEGNGNILTYYGIGGLPMAIFQGQTSYTGGSEATYEFYHNILVQYLNIPAEVIFSDITYTVNGNELDCSVMISINGEITDTDLMLKYSLIEEESRINNYNGDPCLQVSLFNGSQSLEGVDLEQEQDFTVPLPAEPIPEDIVLLIWVQTMADEYNPDICKIHNVAEQNITIGR